MTNLALSFLRLCEPAPAGVAIPLLKVLVSKFNGIAASSRLAGLLAMTIG